MASKPAVHVIAGDALLWSVEDARLLREQHRIVAGPVGSLPRNPLQNIFLSLPLKLQPEEAYLLLRHGLITIVDEAHGYDQPQQITSQHPSSEASSAEHSETPKPKYTSVTIRTLSSWLPWYRFHPLKGQETQDSPVAESSGSSRAHTSIGEQSFSPTLAPRSVEVTSLSDPRMKQLLPFPKTKRDHLLLRMYEYLWETHKFYIAPGFKFGGDYLLYASDPLTCHAGWIASVKSLDEAITIRDIASMARLASSVQKSHVFCSFEQDIVLDTQVDASVQPAKAWCFSIEWAGF
ncbi:tRNA-splicing endonuclease subunit [Actinomortierella ambigua]|uniref:tRNA-splicing endonuclease subunit Sen34 n=1 Tax=Actinomortierella ambigua TaxID=1343610 RepID=A0A9P6U815_9FUNG|nr:tRNA-splicing endonuclease subunit [Actinomortierella ambigua]